MKMNVKAEAVRLRSNVQLLFVRYYSLINHKIKTSCLTLCRINFSTSLSWRNPSNESDHTGKHASMILGHRWPYEWSFIRTPFLSFSILNKGKISNKYGLN